MNWASLDRSGERDKKRPSVEITVTRGPQVGLGISKYQGGGLSEAIDRGGNESPADEEDS